MGWRRISGLALALTAAACADGTVSTPAERPVISIAEASPGLAARAAISGDSALAIARTRVPNGEVVEAELEEEDGVLVYEFEIRIEGESAHYDVIVDASTGDVVAVERDEEDDDGEDDDEHGASGR